MIWQDGANEIVSLVPVLTTFLVPLFVLVMVVSIAGIVLALIIHKG